MSRKRKGVCAVLVSALGLLVAALAQAGSWTTLSNYGGSNTMSVYKPSTVASSPGIIVSLHFCGGTMANAQGWFQSLADTHGFLIIAGKSTGDCWDAGLGRSGERDVIVQAVNYVVKNYNADKTRVFSAGASSGACMTQALLASYPDVFAGGSSLAGVPAGAWTGGGAYGWSTSGVSGGAAWGDKVRQADSSFTGTRPRVQLWQGQGDTTLTYAQTYPNEVAQWTNVFGVSNGTAASVKPAGATDTWDRTSYKDSSGTVVVEANSGPSSVPHDLTGRGLWADVVRFFGLDQASTPGGTGGTGGGTGGAAGSGGGNRDGSAGGTSGAKDAGPDVLGTGGVSGTGGVVGSGGAIGGSGGADAGGTSGKGGATGTGGTSNSGGIGAGSGGSGSGGNQGSGGRTGSGGSSAGNGGSGAASGGSGSGGIFSNGGSGSGGSSAKGGSSGESGSSGTSGNGGGTSAPTAGVSSASGCSCAVGSTTGSGKGLTLLLLAAVGLVLRRRRKFLS
jgi:acetylxylan esterase